LFCDNCYGELVEELEPCQVGYDLIAGSLIKNLGGTLAPCGGYIVGKEELVSRALVHLSAPGVDGGATLNQYRHLFQVTIYLLISFFFLFLDCLFKRVCLWLLLLSESR
jgi:cystathionine beta-lyase family protein involved in aluminum resistance